MEHLLVNFPAYPGSYALLCEPSATKAAIVFVHGFWGDAEETWEQFQRLIDTPPFGARFEGVDLFYYDYPSQRHSVKNAAEALGTFLDEMLGSGPWQAALDGTTLRGLNVPSDGEGQARYDRVLLVGHSLGGVLVRKLIAIAAGDLPTAAGDPTTGGEKRDWPILLRRAPRLFAPAHSGFRHDDLVSLIASHSKIAAIIIGYWRYRHARVYAELQEGSGVLTGLKEQTLSLLARHRDCPALRAVVLWGADENVVFDVDYPEDRTLRSVPGKDHQSICKPADDFHEPVEFLIDGLE